ncbi:hypothetical protein A8806_110138 [Faecalicatena orotica]|uniref:Uncharacterized protein n=1 Tax=Faecalicatena orotica TaxID=1544 RepID=A0A2Y9BJE0_9FIRM|nr:hypothetical protein [Faecalicatena orotica]PWJ27963.1 hypothetical protein A8806_110138 [Faecalicatena orotica]SSA56986.1 hypothetical protein SAMN05216536_110138 [Faecalicatena orotica]
MAMTADIKMQIEAIKNQSRIKVIDYGDTVLLTDGWKGPYIKKDKLIIDLDKINHPEGGETYDPNKLKLIKLKRTNHLLITGNRIAIRFDTEDGEHIWTRNDWMKEYGNAFGYATEETKTSVIPIGINGDPLGIVLCMRITDND